MAISTQTFTQFVSNAVAAIQGAATVLVDLTIGSVLRAVVQAASGIALWLQGEVLQTAALTRFASSNGPDADSWGADFSFTRLPAKFTTPGSVTFSRFTPTNQASIQAATNSGTDANGNIIWTGGVIVQTADGSQPFQVIPDTTQPAYSATQNAYLIAAGTASASATVRSVNATAAANVGAGFITLLSQAIPFVDTVTNPAPIAGGDDPETDTAYKVRFPQFISSLSRATKGAISFAVQSVIGGGAGSFTITENQSLGGVPQPGFFFIIADDGTGNPSATFLATIANAVQAVVGETITFGVFAPGLLTANIAMVLTTAAGFVHSAAVAAVTAALRKVINTLPIGAALPYNLLSSIAFSVNGVTNVTGITLNGGLADLAATPQQIVKAGTVAVS
jgi:uncharacterized phage protein gp47/JayE